ncbi:kinase-like protein, partial [Laetiporus sulphureus 93-53]
VARQLFEAVEFMHDHGVAHMDIKPDNIRIPLGYGRLTIIDFGLSVRVKGPRDMLEGYRGTPEYSAPEVDSTRYSPIRADLWSVGQVV